MISKRALRKAAAASARPPARVHVKQAAELQIRLVSRKRPETRPYIRMSAAGADMVPAVYL